MKEDMVGASIIGGRIRISVMIHFVDMPLGTDIVGTAAGSMSAIFELTEEAKLNVLRGFVNELGWIVERQEVASEIPEKSEVEKS